MVFEEFVSVEFHNNRSNSIHDLDSLVVVVQSSGNAKNQVKSWLVSFPENFGKCQNFGSSVSVYNTFSTYTSSLSIGKGSNTIDLLRTGGPKNLSEKGKVPP